MHIRGLLAEYVGPPLFKDHHLERFLVRTPAEIEDVADRRVLHRKEQGPLAVTIVAVIETAKIDLLFSFLTGPESEGLSSPFRIARRRVYRVAVAIVRYRARGEGRVVIAAFEFKEVSHIRRCLPIVTKGILVEAHKYINDIGLLL